jgi:non-ribosomal peptide synthetase component E (peptide arylation enzyme)
LKELINRGGEKLAPAEIDAALLAHPAVAEAAAFAMRDGRLGDASKSR